jgi:hypothetical protein
LFPIQTVDRSLLEIVDATKLFGVRHPALIRAHEQHRTGDLRMRRKLVRKSLFALRTAEGCGVMLGISSIELSNRAVNK